MSATEPVQTTFSVRDEADRDRQRKSFYLDQAVAQRLDSTYRAVNHSLYPDQVTKSLFLETLIEFGLDNLESLQTRLSSA